MATLQTKLLKLNIFDFNLTRTHSIVLINYKIDIKNFNNIG